MTEYEQRQAQSRSEDQQLGSALDELGIDIAPTPEWQVIIALLRGSWPGQVSRSDALAYYLVLNDAPAGDIARAVRELARSGQRFRPTPPEIRSQLGLIERDHEPPTFDEAWAAICRAGIKSRWQAAEALAQLTGPTAAWAQLRGLDRLWKLPTECPDSGRYVMRDLERSYVAFCEAWAVPERRAQLEAPRGDGTLRPLNPVAGLSRPRYEIEG